MEIARPEQSNPAGWQKLAAKFVKQYPDEVFGSRAAPQPDLLARWDRELATREVPGFANTSVAPDFKGSLASALRSTTTHILARELKEADLRASLEAGHAYVAYDWLCDPTGFTFSASNYFGGFEMGDTIVANPLLGETTITARVPVPAKLRLYRNGTLVAEAHDTSLTYAPPKDSPDAEGAYRLEALLTVAGSDRPWIFSNPLYLRKPWDFRLPSGVTPANVEVHEDLPYVEGGGAKQRLDLYIPRGQKQFPVFVFLHGGGWITGDRSLYHALGNRLARAGVGVAIPSYRLMPINPHPAQIEDAAAAFAWTRAHIAEYGGDPRRLYVGGHSSGGHLASLLALDQRYLQAHGLDASAIRGVVSMSGVYDVDRLVAFETKSPRKDASPLHHVRRGAPPFLVSYCQWDYIGLPKQAREFAASLKKSLVETELIYIPKDNHITEIINFTREDGPLLHAVLSFIAAS